MKKLLYRFQSFRVQLQISVMGVLLVVFILVFAALYTTLQSTIANQLDITSNGYFQQLSYAIKALQDNTETCMSSIVNDNNVQLFCSRNFSNSTEEILTRIDAVKSLQKLFAAYSNIDRSIYLMDDYGNVISMSNQYTYSKIDELSPPIYNSPFLSALRKNSNGLNQLWLVGDNRSFYKDTVNSTTWMNDKIITVSKSFTVNSRRFYIIINIDEAKISNLFRYMKVYKTATGYIVDRNGIIVSDPDPSRIGTRSNLIGSNLGSMKSDTTMKLQNKMTVYLYHSLPISGWYSVLEIPSSDYTREITNMRNILALFFLFGVILCIIIISTLMQRLTKPILALKTALGTLGSGNVGYQIKHIPSNELGLLAHQFNKISGELKMLMEENQRIEIEKREFELEMLRSQINPHFIYNTMNMIKWMARIQKNDNIEIALTKLGNMLHPLFSNNQPFCTIEEEISYCYDFISLSNLRYGGAIQLEIQIEQRFMKYYIFRLLLQPIIENAIIHGFIEKTGRCNITISCDEADNWLQLVIQDNGQGMPLEVLEKLQSSLRDNHNDRSVQNDVHSVGSFIGLRNVNSRIKSCFGSIYGLQVDSVIGQGTTVRISIPKKLVL